MQRAEGSAGIILVSNCFQWWCPSERHLEEQDRKRVLALTGFLFDTIEVVVELKDDQKLLFRTNPHLRCGRAEPQPT
jgi:hypothetical protein